MIRYIWAGQQLLAEVTTDRDGQQIERRDYLFFPGRPYPIAMRQNGRSTCLHVGRRGEALCMTDVKGRLVWKARYSAYGEANTELEELRQPWRLAGHYFDEETGLHYTLIRYYSPQLGRFLSRDPHFIEGGSHNFYLYCDGDPLNRHDATGEFIFAAILIGAAIGAGVEAYRQSKAIERGEQEGYDGWGVAKAGLIGGAVGAVGGGVGAAIEGAFGVAVTATIAGGAGVGFLSGAGASIVEQCVEATIKDEPLDPEDMLEQALKDGLIGGVIGAVTGGVGGFLARRARKGVQEAAEVGEGLVEEASERATREATKHQAARQITMKASQDVKDAAVEDMVRRFGMPEKQARAIIDGAMDRGSDVVVGGSRVRGNARPDSDIDIGYNGLSTSQAKKVTKQAKKVEDGLPIEDRIDIVAGNETKNVPKIESAEEFFMRRGTRKPPDPRAGESIEPSGCIKYDTDGSIVEVRPDGTVINIK